MADEDALACAKAAADSHCHGLIISNTSIIKEGLRSPVPEGTGGISGRPVFHRSTELLQMLKEELKELPCIGVGGIMDAAGAIAKEKAGAELIQVYSGFIYGGPQFPIHILRGLLEHAATPAA